MNRLNRHLDVGLRTIVHNMQGPSRYIAAFDFIVPIHIFERRVRQLSDTLRLSLFPLFRFALLRKIFLPLLFGIFRVGERYASNVLIRF